MKIFGFLLITFAVASAQVILPGNCPAVEPVENFEFNSYAGKWYHIEKLPLPYEGVGKCGSVLYTLDGDSLKLKFSQVSNGIETFVTGIINKADDANNAAKLELKINVGKNVRAEPLSILATDYSNYAVSYACKYDEHTHTHRVNLWVMSRTKGLEGEARAAVDTFISSNFGNVDRSKFIPNDLSDEACSFHSSRVYSASSYY